MVSENHKTCQKETVWMKRRSSPVSVLELGRRPPNYDRQDDRLLSLRHLSVISKSIFFFLTFLFGIFDNHLDLRRRLTGGSGQTPSSVPFNFSDQRDPDTTIFLNVGGKRFEVLWNTLGQFPGSRLSRLHDCGTSTAMLEICDRSV